MAKKQFLDRAALKELAQKPREVLINGYGTVFVRHFNADDRIKLSALYKPEDGSEADPQASAKTIIVGLCDEKCKPLFKEKDIDEIEAYPLNLKEALALAVMKANQMTAESIEIATKN